MTAQQFYSEEGQKLSRLENEHRRIMNKDGGFNKAAAKRADRIEKLKIKVEKLYPSPESIKELLKTENHER